MSNAITSRAAALADHARSTRDDRHAWRPGQDLSETRNAHHSNTESEMRDALADDHNWLEGDLRLDESGAPVMAHDQSAEGTGLTLDEWIDVGGAGERGLKVDVKEDAAIPQLVDQLAASGVPGERIMVNVQGDTSADAVRRIRAKLPDAWIAITPKTDSNRYASRGLGQAIELGRVAGGNVAYPMRWDIASDEAIQTVKHSGTGRVSIWTNASEGTPDDTAAETRALRERGVDGVIDLGAPSSTVDKLKQRGKDAYDTAKRGAQQVGETAVDGAVAAGRAVRSGVSSAVDGAKRLLGIE